MSRGALPGRKPLVAGNWKMNNNHLEALALTQQLAFRLSDKDLDAVDVAVLPGGIRKWRAAGKPLQQAAQTTGGRVRKWGLRAAIVVAGVALAYLISPWFLVIPAIAAARWMTAG